MSCKWQSLIDGARDLDRGAAVETVLTELLTRFDLHCASDQPGYAVAELLRALDGLRRRGGGRTLGLARAMMKGDARLPLVCRREVTRA